MKHLNKLAGMFELPKHGSHVESVKGQEIPHVSEKVRFTWWNSFKLKIFISLDISNSQKVIKNWSSQNKQHTHVFWHIWPFRHLGINLLGVISFGNSQVNRSCKLDQIWELRKFSSFHWMCFLVYLFPQPVSIVCWLVSKSY